MEFKKLEPKAGSIDWAKFKVEYREATVRDSIQAEMVSGASSGTKFLIALIAQICTFDGKPMVYEDLLEMPTFFFNQLFAEVTGLKEKELQMLLSSFGNKESSDTRS